MDSLWARGVNKLVQMLWLGVLWFVFCIPVFTIGAATTALYEVQLKAVKNEEGYVTSSFYNAFKRNLKQGVVVGLCFFVVFTIAAINFYFYGFNLVNVIMTMMSFLISIFINPVMAKFENSISSHIKMSIVIILHNPLLVLIALLFQIIAIAVTYFFLYMPIVFVMGPVSYLQAIICNYIFEREIEKGRITVR